MFFYPQKRPVKGKMFAAMLLGAGLGYVAGIMTSPKSGRRMREGFRNWMEQMTEDLRERVENTRDLTQEKYNQLVDSVTEKYRRMQRIKENELGDFNQDLKRRWERVKDEWNRQDQDESNQQQ